MTEGIGCFVAITAIAYWVGDAIKVSKIDSRWIPAILGLLGLVLGVAAYLLKIPTFPATDAVSAAAVGVTSALAATGLNQVYRQARNRSNESETDENFEASYDEDVEPRQ